MRNYYRFLLAAFVVGLLVGLFTPYVVAVSWIVIFSILTFKSKRWEKLFDRFLGEDDYAFHVTIMLWWVGTRWAPRPYCPLIRKKSSREQNRLMV